MLNLDYYNLAVNVGVKCKIISKMKKLIVLIVFLSAISLKAQYVGSGNYDADMQQFLLNANTFMEQNMWPVEPMYDPWEVGNNYNQPTKTEYIYVEGDCMACEAALIKAYERIRGLEMVVRSSIQVE
jgi:hypothetical protein